MIPTARRRASGLMLVELLIAIGLIGVFMIVSARLFTTMIRLSQQSHETEARIARFDSAIRMLRGDAWSATEISLDAAGGLTFADGEKSVVWRSDDAGTMLRSETINGTVPRVQNWPELGGRLQFRAEGPVLVIVADEHSGRGGELRIVSQVRLAGVSP